jgi:hypothetical protein
VTEPGETPERFGLGTDELRVAQDLVLLPESASITPLTSSWRRWVDAANSFKERRCAASCAFNRANCDSFGMDALRVFARHFHGADCILHHALPILSSLIHGSYEKCRPPVTGTLSVVIRIPV